jgi:thioredoxin reductase
VPRGEVSVVTRDSAPFDVLVIGGGQSALATGFYLRRTQLRYALLDAAPAPGGAWREAWPSLRLFSPSRWSSLPGWLMPGSEETYPSRDEVVAYLAEYERRYALPVERRVTVQAVRRDGDALRIDTDGGPRWARAVVSATGSWAAPIVPDLPGRESFAGETRHSAAYAGPSELAGRHVIVVGGGNSGAQIVADLHGTAASVTWATLAPPRFLPDDVDGRNLFEQATVRWHAQQQGLPVPPPRSLGDVVMVPPVKAARDAGRLAARAMFTAFTEDGVRWPDGSTSRADVVIWATGFRPALAHLAPLGVLANGRVAVAGTRSTREPRLWLVGYGDWTGFASATLVGVGRSARATVDEIVATSASG